MSFREIVVEELDSLAFWLENQPLLTQDQAIDKLKALAYDRSRELHLELPTRTV